MESGFLGELTLENLRVSMLRNDREFVLILWCVSIHIEMWCVSIHIEIQYFKKRVCSGIKAVLITIAL